eukprot:TRINITY_DN16907_c0_g1_i2.p1 TRINITY_DN16907_c0_g1~~TRINITY_DN16907_c0_g1_i2.p1  ORF type:complete len:329 (+),score=60.50 TRINITY_DN16907_c0_g1_i2:50-1036(+)
MGRHRSRSRSRRKSESGDDEDLSAEARLALLEVENETLKAENRELRKKLMQVLRKGGAAGERSGGGGGDKGSSERNRGREPERKERREDREERKEESRKKARSPSPVRQESRKKARSPSPPGQGENDSDTNAVLLCNAQMEAYNEPIPNNIPPEKRLPLVAKKLERFMANFDEKVQILDLKSGGAIIKDQKTFIKRYTCVFRESGAKLTGSCLKRFYFDSKGPTYCLDYEMHESLVTAMPGTPPDGKLGVRDPRTEYLMVLYEEKGGKLTRLWLRQDTEKLGADPTATEAILEKSEGYQAMEAKIKELKGGKLGERIFHNYHDIPTVG